MDHMGSKSDRADFQCAFRRRLFCESIHSHATIVCWIAGVGPGVSYKLGNE